MKQQENAELYLLPNLSHSMSAKREAETLCAFMVFVLTEGVPTATCKITEGYWVLVDTVFSNAFRS